MSFRLSDYAENKLADFLRGVSMSLPSAWYFALLSSATDSGFVELGGTGYSRVAVTRALANFAGTQGAGTTAASNGTTHTTSNNSALNWGTAGSNWGTANLVGMYDAAVSGHCWIYLPVPSPVIMNTGVSFSVDAGDFAFTMGLTGGMSDYLCNVLIDFLMRGQAFTYPTPTFAALFRTLPTNAGGGAEPGSVTYGRASIPSDTTSWSGTQGSGSTSTSIGSAGRISNNVPIVFANPPLTDDWGSILGAGLYDSNISGNLLFWAPFTTGTQTLVGGTSAPTFDINTMGITFD